MTHLESSDSEKLQPSSPTGSPGSAWIEAHQAATRMGNCKRGRYTPAENALILQMRRGGATIYTIALRLGRTWHAVQKHMYNLGIEPKPRRTRTRGPSDLSTPETLGEG